MKSLIFNNVAAAATFSLAVLLSTQAGAEELQEQALSARMIETQSISIAYHASDLATDEGRADLYGKIKRAAKAVCGPTGARDAGGLSLASRNRECYDSAIEAALSQVDTGQMVTLVN